MYTKDHLIAAVRACGVDRGDIVMAHVGMSALGDLPEGVNSQDELSNFCISALLEVIGESGILVVPAFSYSFGRRETFDPSSTPCRNIGTLPEYFRRLPGVKRSEDPFLSVSAIGPLAEELTRTVSNTSYGKGSFFDRFIEAGGKNLSIGVNIATLRYYITELACAPFRYLKLFDGQIKRGDKFENVTWEYSVAPMAQKPDAMSRRFGAVVEREILARSPQILKIAPLARGEIRCFDAKEYVDFAAELIRTDPWIFSEGELSSVDDIIKFEEERTGRENIVISTSSSDVRDMVRQAAPLRREVVSDSTEAVVRALADGYGYEISRFTSGTRAGAFVVPERWLCRRASLSTLSGDGIISAERDPLFVATNSGSFSGEIDRDRLCAHIAPPDERVGDEVIQHRSMGWFRELGLSLSRRSLSGLVDDRYALEVETYFSYGALLTASACVRGSSRETVLLVGRLDGPCQFNYGIAGSVVCVDLFEQIRAMREPRYTYRIALVPGAAGLACFMTECGYTARDLAACVYVDMPARDLPLTLKIYNARGHRLEVIAQSVADRTSRLPPGASIGCEDEIARAAGGVPTLCLYRAGEGAVPFDEFGTNSDTIDRACEQSMERTLQALVSMIDRFERR